MKIVSVGGGPAGLYFAILMKKADPGHRIAVLERNRPDDTFGFGVVFSDATLEGLAEADPESHDEITRSFAHWDDIEVHWKGERHLSTGHGFSGLSRQRLLDILQRRAAALGVELVHQREVADPEPLRRDADLVLGADGVNSTVRARYQEHFGPALDFRPNRFVWLGTTFPFPAFTFWFKEDRHGLWRVHAYRYEAGHSTFILEASEATWRRAGLDRASEDETVAFAERLFADELQGHRILKNRSIWRSFPIVRCGRWHHENVVLVGDAAHTAHFSIGSGTKLALEDAIALREAVLAHRDVPRALAAYEAKRRPTVESIQRAAQTSLEWFEDTERYAHLEPIQFVFSLLTRSLRVTHENLRVRDPAFVKRIDAWFARRAGVESVESPPPPLFTPYRVRGLVLPNRVVVSPMCQYSAKDGTPDEWHLVHLGSRAIGGAGLVLTEMTDVSADARISPGCTGLYTDEHTEAWKRIVAFIHGRTPARVGIQLGHAGRKGSTRLAWEGMDEPLAEGNWPIISASAIPYGPRNQVPRAMTRADMDRVTGDFVAATRRAVAAGFDWLELHFAHGYLLSSFLSPLTNARTDEYGGPLENRLRYPLEVLRACREVWRGPISVRISAVDWAPGGNTAADGVAIARALHEDGADLIDVSTGQVVLDAKPQYGRLYQTPFADRIRHEARVPTMTVGNVTSFADVNSILAAGRADLCVLARAHLYDPYWTRHAAAELGHDLEWPEPYSTVRRWVPRLR